MKKAILISILILGTVCNTFAQQKGKTKHMIISIYETYFWGKSPNVFITRDDTAQVRKFVQFNLNTKGADEEAVHENQMMQIMEPYYHDGWKLVTTSTGKNPRGTYNISRFFFTKDE